MAAEKVKLQGLEMESITVDIQVASMSRKIRTMLDDMVSTEGAEKLVPLPNVRLEILTKIMEWAEHHQNDPAPTPEEEDESLERRTDDISDWDKEFLKVEHAVLYDIIVALNDLDIKGLLDVTCKHVANMIKGKTPEEIRETFNIKNDFTPAEEEQIRKEVEWCED